MRPNFLGGGGDPDAELTRETITLCAIARAAKALQIFRRGRAARAFRHDMVTFKRDGKIDRTAEPARAANVIVTRLDLRRNLCRNRFLSHGWTLSHCL